MIEDPDLTRQILEYFAQDDVEFPANKTVEDDLTEAFPKVELSRLKYHVMCAKENDLLIANIRENPMMDGTEFVFGLHLRAYSQRQRICPWVSQQVLGRSPQTNREQRDRGHNETLNRGDDQVDLSRRRILTSDKGGYVAFGRKNPYSPGIA